MTQKQLKLNDIVFRGELNTVVRRGSSRGELEEALKRLVPHKLSNPTKRDRRQTLIASDEPDLPIAMRRLIKINYYVRNFTHYL